MEKTEQIAAIGRIREFVSDVRLGKRSVFKPMDILMDLKRLEDARAEPEGHCGCNGPGCPTWDYGYDAGLEAQRERVG